MKIGYAAKIGFRTIRSTEAALNRILRAGGQVRIGRNGPPVTHAAAAGIIAFQLNKAAKKNKAAEAAADSTKTDNAAVDAADADSGHSAGKRNLALSMIRTGFNIRRAARTTETVYNLVQFGRKHLRK